MVNSKSEHHLNPKLKLYASGVMDEQGKFYPFKVYGSISPAATPLAAKKNVRYFIKSIVLTYATLVADAGTSITVTGTVLQESTTLAVLMKTTLVVNIGSQMFEPCVLCDREAAVTFAAANITTKGLQMVYAEVDDAG